MSRRPSPLRSDRFDWRLALGLLVVALIVQGCAAPVPLPTEPEVPVRGSGVLGRDRDFAIVAEMLKGRRTHDRVSFDVNPTSRQILEKLVRDGHLLSLIQAGARIHQADFPMTRG